MSDFGHQNPSSPLSTLPTHINQQHQQLVGKNKTTKRTTRPNNKNKTTNNFDESRNNNRLPCKVVHISNPMKFQVNATEFRTLVQELTGRDAAEWPDYYNNNHQAEVVGEAASGVSGANNHDNGNDEDDDEVVEIHQEWLDGHQVDYSGSSDLSLDYFGPFDGDAVMCGHHEHESHSSRVIMEDFQGYLGVDHLYES